MNNNYPLQNNQQSTTNSVIRPEQSHSSNITYNNFSTYDNNNYTSTTPYVPYVNNNYTALNESIASTSHSYPLPSQQNVENPPNLLFNMTNNCSPPNPFNMTNIISPSRSEIHTFEIPGYKVILIPTFSQYDNIHFTQFRQFR
ncbi:uncharacterized protein OCT59_001717 [Rhizophagus irregularis]|uniref:Uncharacterized protein n=2 Tax=Rhizophagus irregularis TaxID=588596 RepID=U9UBG7_RHIID|nr:hypothetical protein GLOIN_2v1764327 [Rhizophagus irregularis DAOM 181602=DAOM 197198]EXX66703.1 hypothetical protein RirG_121260 [Rhizophagus irregularis DAOM 197198w]POG80487.1 hypothetical protein GLOIN_2v1764327 [Rhizophagus irregularis DAOM 181602=DAOM 197198]UZO10119.1 hypothetical protein OCT59_001717 [Rhizophagus irregularis]GBC41266.1 hypothetical protein GLOIN_2v1764327 [Rhizophagus irregularis DAOM 181602=DAOM 197198]|eukprot:XP_025187353.1 hypothetical protein GLOIN_2v1764327 [Rhizophagus irregularis DAOM 181602=DAOM 197198]